jgi:hypothetical protein
MIVITETEIPESKLKILPKSPLEFSHSVTVSTSNPRAASHVTPIPIQVLSPLLSQPTVLPTCKSIQATSHLISHKGSHTPSATG